MNDLDTVNDFLSYITPDPRYPKAGIVRISNNKIKYIAKKEGFIGDETTNYTKIISDEERLVVKILFNHYSTVFLHRDLNSKNQLSIFFHKDGIISCENEAHDVVAFHCFSEAEDLLAYHINDFIPADYDNPLYPFHFLIPTDGTLYKEPHTINYSEKLKTKLLEKLRNAEKADINRYKIEKQYIEEWDSPSTILRLFANNQSGEVGLLAFLFCESCIWAIYPYENNYARIKVMGSTEAQNKFCEFITSFADIGDL